MSGLKCLNSLGSFWFVFSFSYYGHFVELSSYLASLLLVIYIQNGQSGVRKSNVLDEEAFYVYNA